MCYVNYEKKSELSFPFSYLSALKLTSFINEYHVDFYQKGDPYFNCHFVGNSLDFIFKYFDKSILEKSYCHLEYEASKNELNDINFDWPSGYVIVDLKERLLDILSGKLYCDCYIDIEFKEKEKK